MQFVGLVFEILLCGVWWLLAIYMLVVGMTGVAVANLVPSGAGEAITGLLFLAIAYLVGHGGRSLARDTFQELRREITLERFSAHPLSGWLRRTGWTTLVDLGWDENLALPEASGSDQPRSEHQGGTELCGPQRLWRAVRRALDWADVREALGLGREAGDADATRQARKAYDVMRDYVLAYGDNYASYEILNHWDCMRVARNCYWPAALMTVAAPLYVARELWGCGLILLLPLTYALAVTLRKRVYLTFMERAKYLPEAVLRGFAIVSARQPHRNKLTDETTGTEDASGSE